MLLKSMSPAHQIQKMNIYASLMQTLPFISGYLLDQLQKTMQKSDHRFYVLSFTWDEAKWKCNSNPVSSKIAMLSSYFPKDLEAVTFLFVDQSFRFEC